MTDEEAIELWAERAAIIEEGQASDPLWKLQPDWWRRHEAERLAYWDIRRKHGIERMPKECWRDKRDAAG